MNSSNKIVKDEIRENCVYDGFTFYTKKQKYVCNNKFDNCSFRENLNTDNMNDCVFTNCSFRELDIWTLSNTDFGNSFISKLRVVSGMVKKFWKTNIQILTHPGMFQIDRTHEDILYVTIFERAGGTENLLGILTEFIDVDSRKVLITYDSGGYCSFDTLERLLIIDNNFRSAERDIRFFGLPERALGMFNTLGILDHFVLYDTEEDAIASFS